MRLIWIFLAVGAGGLAQQKAAEVPYIRVRGEAVISVAPDQASIELGVITQASSAQAAAAQNAGQSQAVLERLRKLLGTKATIETAGYSLSPNYRHPRDGGKPEITGYTASNIVRIKTSNLSQVGAIIDAANQAGANTVRNLEFTLRDEAAANARALAEATQNARAQAAAIAKAAGLKIVRLLSIEQAEAPEARPMHGLLMAQAPEARAPTPVEPGMIELRAAVTLVVQVEP